MKKSARTIMTRGRLIAIFLGLLAFVSLPLFTSARTAPMMSLEVVNNSNHTIRSVYISHVDQDDWSGNQLSAGSTIGPGQSATLGNVTCDSQQVKVIAENQDGCFLTTVVSCGSSATATITSQTAIDCGNQ
jgi:hypothetical protein